MLKYAVSYKHWLLVVVVGFYCDIVSCELSGTKQLREIDSFVQREWVSEQFVSGTSVQAIRWWWVHGLLRLEAERGATLQPLTARPRRARHVDACDESVTVAAVVQWNWYRVALVVWTSGVLKQPNISITQRVTWVSYDYDIFNRLTVGFSSSNCQLKPDYKSVPTRTVVSDKNFRITTGMNYSWIKVVQKIQCMTHYMHI